MLGVTIICEAKLKEKYLRDAADEYIKRLGGYCKLNIVELAPKKLPDNPSENEIASALSAEGKEILSKIPAGSKVQCAQGGCHRCHVHRGQTAQLGKARQGD